MRTPGTAVALTSRCSATRDITSAAIRACDRRAARSSSPPIAKKSSTRALQLAEIEGLPAGVARRKLRHRSAGNAEPVSVRFRRAGWHPSASVHRVRWRPEPRPVGESDGDIRYPCRPLANAWRAAVRFTSAPVGRLTRRRANADRCPRCRRSADVRGRTYDARLTANKPAFALTRYRSFARAAHVGIRQPGLVASGLVEPPAGLAPVSAGTIAHRLLLRRRNARRPSPVRPTTDDGPVRRGYGTAWLPHVIDVLKTRNQARQSPVLEARRAFADRRVRNLPVTSARRLRTSLPRTPLPRSVLHPAVREDEPAHRRTR